MEGINMKIVIIGGVAGGATAAARLRRIDENAKIVMVERGEYISFANCGLPYHISGVIKERSSLMVQTPAGFKSRFNIDVRNKTEAVKINRDEQKVILKDLITGREYEESYDYVILSPGAEPIRPNLNGADSDRIFTLRNIPDLDRIISGIKKYSPKRAVVIGGGFIGLEVAENLLEKNRRCL
jgi:tRNA 2-thiouridine synthesizing protein A